TLTQIATPWTAGAKTDREKLAAIQHELARFEYSLHVDWDWHRDPIVDFLKYQHKGHCELFASSMALLARASGIPARVVTGYRVSEENELGDYAIVRQNNGHSWVEAWVDGAWRTYDPTPPTEEFTPQHGRLDHALDAAGAFADRVGRRTLAAGAAFVFAVLWAIRRWVFPLVGRLFSRRRAKDASGLPLPCLVTLESALAARGHARDPSEPLEHFARRIEETHEPWTAAVSAALRAYAALRYGGLGEEKDVVRAVERAASTIGR
ncbi:MAG TPA: transglutaminase-like domain-containing protein, partial [Labilithrix sp.]